MKTVGTPAARLTVAFALALWIALSQIPHTRPSPLPANAPVIEFSAARAIEHVRAIAQKPHPMESAEHDRVRDYIVGDLVKQGLAPQIERGFAEFTYGQFHGSGNVQNIVARLPGTANTRPVMLAAHYDSVTRGPGAGDDGHGVAVLLETLRALRAGPPMRNDVIFLITDGEERGLLGAQVFMREHPWRSEPGVVLNFDARGTSGSAVMFETSTGNRWLIRGLQAAVPDAVATSVAYEIYRRMPNGTDLTVFKKGGLQGMNFAFIEHPDYYHTAQDTVEHLDPVSVQEQGRYALSLTRWFGKQDLTVHPPGDGVYFTTAFTPLIVYPAKFAAILAVIILLGALVAAWRRPWLGIPLLLLAALDLWVSVVAPGASSLMTWPLLGGVIALLLLSTAPTLLAPGWRVAAIALCAAPGFLLVIPLVSSLIVALSLRGAAPVLAVSAILMLVCLLPQLRFASSKA
jgi:Peptidase family M28